MVLTQVSTLEDLYQSSGSVLSKLPCPNASGALPPRGCELPSAVHYSLFPEAGLDGRETGLRPAGWGGRNGVSLHGNWTGLSRLGKALWGKTAAGGGGWCGELVLLGVCAPVPLECEEKERGTHRWR